MAGLISAGELASQIAHYGRSKQKNETDEQYAERKADGLRLFPPAPPVSAGSSVQVSFDGTENYHPARVIKVEGAGITVRVTMPGGQELERCNVRHETDPMVNTVEYRDLWTQPKAEGGLWKYADNEQELRRRIGELETKLGQLLADKQSDPADDAVPDLTPAKPKAPPAYGNVANLKKAQAG